jgi:hypothetical protein
VAWLVVRAGRVSLGLSVSRVTRESHNPGCYESPSSPLKSTTTQTQRWNLEYLQLSDRQYKHTHFMFGESDSESPRVPSPWDSLSSAPSSPPKQQGIPKLVPEAEQVCLLSCLLIRLITQLTSQGNVEYKLQLLTPSPARFARLVTQLKWRLLEGGGQAYYELGVADSGTLVGLPRQQLEESLETLEMMAGEIGASVIVVKEIEVPPELSCLAESQLERWDGRSSTRRKDLLRMMKRDDESPTTSATEVETRLSNTDLTDLEGTTCYSPVSSPSSSGGESNPTQFSPSPTPLPFDSAFTIFTVDVEEDVADYADNEASDDDVPADCVAEFTVSLEISSVYKPRPMKKRAAHITHFEYVTKRLKNGYPPSKSTHTTSYTTNPIVQGTSETLHQPSGAKSQVRRDKREKGQELKLNTLLTRVPTRRSTESPTDSADHHTIPSCSTDEPNLSGSESSHTVVDDLLSADTSGTTAIALKEPRLIVEALVVRELSLDEVFLDFEGFSLQ